MSLLLAYEMRFIIGNVHILHLHCIILPWWGAIILAITRRGKYFPMAATGHVYENKNNQCALSPSILAWVFLLIRTENINDGNSELMKKRLWWIVSNYYFQIFTRVIGWSEKQYCISWQSCLSVFFLLSIPCSRCKDNSRKQKWERKNTESESGSFWWWSPTKTWICTI